ncbi:putative sphingolipid transporter spinster-like protein 2 [Cucumis melo var. makuwa]|uniref:Putative sphingolipid transporter spinster-like protein 2 n=1 Tax=Cucumis melo var. makuwa TaxID=1194695 RepID=A0A5D3E139_CUCMM|nr:putative sphingolipid transporter spinster-like protein 2 [Cucumis melo var. makuwa]
MWPYSSPFEDGCTSSFTPEKDFNFNLDVLAGVFLPIVGSSDGNDHLEDSATNQSSTTPLLEGRLIKIAESSSEP